MTETVGDFLTRLAVIREKSKVQVPEEDHLRECRCVLLPLLPLGSRGLPAGVGRRRRRLPPQGDEDAVGAAAAADAAGRGRAPVGVGGGGGGGLDGGGVAVGAEPLELLVGGGEVLAAGVTRVLLAKFLGWKRRLFDVKFSTNSLPSLPGSPP